MSSSVTFNAIGTFFAGNIVVVAIANITALIGAGYTTWRISRFAFRFAKQVYHESIAEAVGNLRNIYSVYKHRIHRLCYQDIHYFVAFLAYNALFLIMFAIGLIINISSIIIHVSVKQREKNVLDVDWLFIPMIKFTTLCYTVAMIAIFLFSLKAVRAVLHHRRFLDKVEHAQPFVSDN